MYIYIYVYIYIYIVLLYGTRVPNTYSVPSSTASASAGSRPLSAHAQAPRPGPVFSTPMPGPVSSAEARAQSHLVSSPTPPTIARSFRLPQTRPLACSVPPAAGATPRPTTFVGAAPQPGASGLTSLAGAGSHAAKGRNCGSSAARSTRMVSFRLRIPSIGAPRDRFVGTSSSSMLPASCSLLSPWKRRAMVECPWLSSWDPRRLEVFPSPFSFFFYYLLGELLVCRRCDCLIYVDNHSCFPWTWILQLLADFAPILTASPALTPPGSGVVGLMMDQA